MSDTVGLMLSHAIEYHHSVACDRASMYGRWINFDLLVPSSILGELQQYLPTSMSDRRLSNGMSGSYAL